MAKYKTEIVKRLLCDNCETQLEFEDWCSPYVPVGENNYCPECAIKNKMISPIEYLHMTGRLEDENRPIEMCDNVIIVRDSIGRALRKYPIDNKWHG